MSDGKVEYEITGDASGLAGAARRGESAIGGLSGAGRVMAAGLTAAIAGVTAAATGMGIAIREAAKIETTETGIKTLVKDAGLAKAIVNDLKKLGAETPFEVGELAGVAQQLLGAGSAVKDLRSEILTMGDIASGAQTPMGDLVQVWNKIRGATKLTGETFAQLSEKGIGGLREEISKVTGIPIENLVDGITEGKVSAEQMWQVFRNMTSDGGLYFNAMKAQSETLSGRLSTLSDEFKALLRVPGEAGLGPAKALVDTLISGTQKATQGAQVFVKALQMASSNGTVGELLGLSVALGLRKAGEGFVNYLFGTAGALRQAFADEIGNGLAMAYNKFAGLIGAELAPVDKDSGLKAFFEASAKTTADMESDFLSRMQAAADVLKKEGEELDKKLKDVTSGSGGSIKSGASEIKQAVGELKAAKDALKGDRDGDGIISKREQRRLDLEQKRAERRANSAKGFSFQQAGLGAFGGLDEFFALQFRDGADGTGFEGERAFSAFGDRRRGVASASQVGRASRIFNGVESPDMAPRDAAFRRISEGRNAGVNNTGNTGEQGNLSALEAILLELKRIRTA